MSEAYICSPHRSQISGTPPLKVGTKPTSIADDVPGGNIRAKATESTRAGEFQIGALEFGQAETVVDEGDLCEDCADAFTEFWNDPGS